MRAATGPIQTGIYIGQAVDFPSEYGTVNDDASKVALTGNHQSPGAKWNVERIGDDLFRIRHLNSNTSPLVRPGQEVGLGQGTSDIIIKETDVKGEYVISPAQYPSLFFSAAKVQGELKINVGATKTRTRLFYADK